MVSREVHRGMLFAMVKEHPPHETNMSFRHLIVAIALFSAAAAAHAGLVHDLPESATVSLVFVALATVGLAMTHKRRVATETDNG